MLRSTELLRRERTKGLPKQIEIRRTQITGPTKVHHRRRHRRRDEILRLRSQAARRGCSIGSGNGRCQEKAGSHLQRIGKFSPGTPATQVCRKQVVRPDDASLSICKAKERRRKRRRRRGILRKKCRGDLQETRPGDLYQPIRYGTPWTNQGWLLPRRRVRRSTLCHAGSLSQPRRMAQWQTHLGNLAHF